MKILFCISLMVWCATTAFAQLRPEVSPFFGYQYGGKHDLSEGEINISSAPDYGIIIGIPVKETPGLRAEIYYSRQETELHYQQNQFEPMNKLFSMTSNYFLAGGSYEEDLGIFTPIGLFAVGVAYLDPKEPGYTSEWFLAATLGFGFKTYFSERVGLRVQGRLLAPIQISDGTVWCTSGSGCYIELTAGTIILQADVTAGLVIVL